MSVHDLGVSTPSERWLRRVPANLIEYPMEVLLGCWGVVSGLPVLLGVAAPTSINALLPGWVAHLWGGFLLLGGVTIGWGLYRRHYGTVVAHGLQLLGTACLVYALAILAMVGWRQGIPGGPLLTIISVLCWLRAWWLVVRDRILRRIERASR